VPGPLRAKEHAANSYLTLDEVAIVGRSVDSFLTLDALVNAGRSVDSCLELGEPATAESLVADEMECLAVGMLTGLGTLAPDEA
jgi:hypothetical protein